MNESTGESLSLNFSKMAGTIPSRSSSLTRNPNRSATQDMSSHTGFTDRPLGWKPKRSSTRIPELGSTSKDMCTRRWDGAARNSREWDGLRRDPELWYPGGNCLVHLYGRGQSRRGPAFRIPMDALIEANCRPLLDRFLARSFDESPISEYNSSEDGGYFSQTNSRQHEIYIPPPQTSERGQTFLYHMATRNFFAWIFGRSLVGTHLGGALVGLLNSMAEFRSEGTDNVQDLLDFLEEEGYADMRNSPDHALAILFFAEHFRFKDLYIDAFAHSCGMHEQLPASPGFEFISRTSRALITRSKLEMDFRLQSAGQRLGSFLSDDLSDAYLGLSPGARSHLDKFRSFLQSYYVSKFGYYPPSNGAFPKNIYAQMCNEFQMLYDLLVDTHFSTADDIPTSQQGGICVLQSVQAFDARQKYSSLPHPIPLLPEVDETVKNKTRLSKRFSFNSRSDKMKPDPRLVAFASLNKATNRHNQALYDCTLVRAYRGFEKECVFSPTKADKNERLSLGDARKVRWILVYTLLQTLLSVTEVPEQVHHTQNVPYRLCVSTEGTPPWRNERPLKALIRSQTEQTKRDFVSSLPQTMHTFDSVPSSPTELKPDIDYFALTHTAQHSQSSSASMISTIASSKGTVRRVLGRFGNMPKDDRNYQSKRASFHEIVVSGYGNGTNNVTITSKPSVGEGREHARNDSVDSSSSSTADTSSEWSKASVDAGGLDSPRTSIASRRRSGASNDFMNDVKVTQEVTVSWEDAKLGEANDELLKYLQS